MVPSEHNDLTRPRYLHRQDEQKHLNGKVAPIDIIPQKDVFSSIAIPPNILVQQLQKIVELTMNVPNDSDRVIDQDKVRLSFYVLWRRY